jgi:two-component system, NtrC family, sensor kinase
MSEDASTGVAEQLNALGQLAAGVGHHVINALSAIVSNAEMLRLTAGTEKPADPALIADMIIKTGLEAAGVARRLIDVSRPATAIGEDRVVLSAIATTVLDEQRDHARSGVIWKADLREVPSIKGDADQLRSMLVHLITNAREALPASGGTITLATSLDERGWVALEIRDTGCGMTSGVQERAVEPFFSTKGRLGVGLSIANGIWRRHRGTLALKSYPSEGTQVRLCVDPR